MSNELHLDFIAQAQSTPPPAAGEAADLTPEVELSNFFIVGAPKAASTSLHVYLVRHLQIVMSRVKETHYLCTEMRPWNFKDPGAHRETSHRAAKFHSLGNALDAILGTGMRMGRLCGLIC